MNQNKTNVFDLDSVDNIIFQISCENLFQGPIDLSGNLNT